MPAFRFRLEKVLGWQRTARDTEEFKLKQLNREMADGNAALAQLRASRLATELEVRSFESLGGRDLAALAAYTLRMEKREQQQAEACRACAERVAAQRTRWMEAQRRCQLLEKLKLRRRADFNLQQDRQNESLATELYLAGWPR